MSDNNHQNDHLHRMLLSSLKEVERYASSIDLPESDIEDEVVEAKVVASRISDKIEDYLTEDVPDTD